MRLAKDPERYGRIIAAEMYGKNMDYLVMPRSIIEDAIQRQAAILDKSENPSKIEIRRGNLVLAMDQMSLDESDPIPIMWRKYERHNIVHAMMDRTGHQLNAAQRLYKLLRFKTYGDLMAGKYSENTITLVGSSFNFTVEEIDAVLENIKQGLREEHALKTAQRKAKKAARIQVEFQHNLDYIDRLMRQAPRPGTISQPLPGPRGG